MISFRQADFRTHVNRENEVSKVRAGELSIQEFQKAKNLVGEDSYEWEFDEFPMGDKKYSGTLIVYPDANFVGGSPRTMDDPGEPDYFEIDFKAVFIAMYGAYENYDEVTDTDGEELSDPQVLAKLAEAVSSAKSEEISQHIEDELIKSRADDF